MSPKAIIMLFLTIGSIAGGYIPTFFGISAFSFASIIWSSVGAIVGVYLGYQLVKDQF